ncbi:oligosaccharide repeat unit polymerase [Clostridium grantii]|nr:oligosaccharide repeat unit polymerase [Clostridium grantii]
MRERYLKIFKKKINICHIINGVYILLLLVENYIGSKNIFPYIFGIDIHAYSAPIISFFTRSLFVIFVYNYLGYDNFKKKIFIIYPLIDVMILMVGRGARMEVFIAYFEILIFFFMYNANKIKEDYFIIAKAISISLVILFIGVSMGNFRVHNQTKGMVLIEETSSEDDEEVEQDYSVGYKDMIQYSGPLKESSILPWYYGYFPMSFANLNLSIKDIKENNVQTYGIYTARPILVGLFELDNLVHNYKDMEYAQQFKKYYTPAATVTTGFTEFYLDFGNFAFISIMVYAFVLLYFYNGLRKNPYFLVFYSFFVGQWFFMSFQNTMIKVITIYGLIFLFIIYKFLTVHENYNNRIDKA